MSSTCDLGPSFVYHIIDGNAPKIFFTFWIIAGVSMLATTIITVPTLLKLIKTALAIRDKNDDILIPQSYRISIIILAFPLVAVFNNLVILFSPVTAPALNFLTSLYGSITMLLFVGLIIQYLGLKIKSNHSNDHPSWQQNAPPSKFYAANPCCCLSPCVQERTITTKDFRKLFIFIIQFVIVFPLAVFVQQFPGIASTSNGWWICLIIQAISVNICTYGTNAILRASKDVLKQYKIECIYQYVQLGFNLWWLPGFVIGFIDIKNEGARYPKSAMVAAYGAVTQCIIWVLLAVVYRYYFNLTTAHQAHLNVAGSSYVRLEAGPTIQGSQDI
eukprot:272555_1